MRGMASRATWKGFLKISLVTIPVQVFPATESAGSISFNQLHAACSTRIQQKRWCPKCEKDVSNTDLVKGYEVAKGQYVTLEDSDFEQVRPDSTRVIDLVQFAAASELDPMFVDRTYFLAPDGQTANDAYAVMADGMATHIGVGKLAIYGREYLVAVRSVTRDGGGRALVLHTLHHAAELRDIAAVDALDHVPAAAPLGEVKLARQVIAAFERPLDLSDYRDAYRDQLQQVIDAKIAGEAITMPTPPAIVPVNLMEALKESLQRISSAKKTPAKAGRSTKRKKPAA
jgi:DNA end-binding protein Ku